MADNDRFAPLIMRTADLISEFLVDRRLRQRWQVVWRKLEELPLRKSPTDAGIWVWHRQPLREYMLGVDRLIDVLKEPGDGRPSPLVQLMLTRELLTFIDEVDRRIDDCVARGNDAGGTW